MGVEEEILLLLGVLGSSSKIGFFFAGGPWGQVAQIDGKDCRVPPHFTVPVSWGVHFPLKPDQLKRVEAVLVNSCPSQKLLTTYNLLESRLVPPSHKMEDAVIGALTRKRSRPPTTKRDQNKDAPATKRKNIVQQVPPLQALPPAPAKVGESSGAATDPASSSPPVAPRSRLPDSRAEHLVPYLNELSKLVSKKDLEDFDGCTLGELVGAMQYSTFHLSCMTTYYKAKVGRYDRKMKEDIQSATTRADVAEKKAGELNELTKVKEDLQRQRAMYEAQLESLRDSHRAQVENLEREADNQYDQGLRHSYRCIMAVLGKQRPDLKMDDLAAGVAQHMDEEAAKEDAEGIEPIVIEEESSPPRSLPADVGEVSTPAVVAEASTPRTQLVIPPRTWGESPRLCLVEQDRAWHMVLPPTLENFPMFGILLVSTRSSRSDHVWLLSRHKQAVRLDEPLLALEIFSNALESARLRVVEQILACLASASP
ncbi:hypothetical protein CUMW_272220 [Citrus unshiu]|uniref:Uncharacterized protein n=1 Tax=Citrus unshiu TaxID=55188 RepID=A0A2H5MUV9_CITUN|nr:hypothetical protein CUMW_272220 [Citrus unshiu]